MKTIEEVKQGFEDWIDSNSVASYEANEDTDYIDVDKLVTNEGSLLSLLVLIIEERDNAIEQARQEGYKQGYIESQEEIEKLRRELEEWKYYDLVHSGLLPKRKNLFKTKNKSNT